MKFLWQLSVSEDSFFYFYFITTIIIKTAKNSVVAFTHMLNYTHLHLILHSSCGKDSHSPFHWQSSSLALHPPPLVLHSTPLHPSAHTSPRIYTHSSTSIKRLSLTLSLNPTDKIKGASGAHIYTFGSDARVAKPPFHVRAPRQSRGISRRLAAI